MASGQTTAPSPLSLAASPGLLIDPSPLSHPIDLLIHLTTDKPEAVILDRANCIIDGRNVATTAVIRPSKASMLTFTQVRGWGYKGRFTLRTSLKSPFQTIASGGSRQLRSSGHLAKDVVCNGPTSEAVLEQLKACGWPFVFGRSTPTPWRQGNSHVLDAMDERR